MQNHYNLLYREEEREMLPLLKVSSRCLCVGARIITLERSTWIISTSASGVFRGVPWQEVTSLDRGTRPACAWHRIRECSRPHRKSLEPDRLQSVWNVQGQQWVRGDRGTVRNIAPLPFFAGRVLTSPQRRRIGQEEGSQDGPNRRRLESQESHCSDCRDNQTRKLEGDDR